MHAYWCRDSQKGCVKWVTTFSKTWIWEKTYVKIPGMLAFNCCEIFAWKNGKSKWGLHIPYSMNAFWHEIEWHWNSEKCSNMVEEKWFPLHLLGRYDSPKSPPSITPPKFNSSPLKKMMLGRLLFPLQIKLCGFDINPSQLAHGDKPSGVCLTSWYAGRSIFFLGSPPTRESLPRILIFLVGGP